MATELLLDRYEILETVGRGGSSEIFKAFDRRMERTVAIKAIPVDKKTALRALREARTVALLNHPNIVTVYEFEETDGFYYLIMEYIEGITLEDFLVDQAPLDAELAAAVAIQVCQALENAHLNDIIHRDIKPANLMLLPDGRVKVMDFGISRLKGTPVTREGTITGTFTYMSPEQAGGELVDERSDVWSLGVVLYEMLTGVNPFAAKTPAAAVMKILNSEPRSLPELNPKISAKLGQVVLKALRKYPEDRFDLATDFRYKLERYRRSNRSPRLIVKEALAELAPIPAVDPNARPITYLRMLTAEFLQRYGQAAARLAISGLSAVSLAWLALELGGLPALFILTAAAATFILLLIFPRFGLLVAGLFLALAVAVKSISIAAAVFILFLVYWYGLGRRLPQAAALPLIAPLMSVFGIPFAYPLGITIITESGAAPIIAALGYLTSVLAEIILKTSFIMPLSPPHDQPLNQLISPAVIWQTAAWAAATLAGGLLVRGNRLWLQIAAISTTTAILAVAYQAAPAYLDLPRPASSAFMQPMSISFIIILIMLLIFYHPQKNEHLQDKGAKGDYISRDRKEIRKSV